MKKFFLSTWAISLDFGLLVLRLGFGIALLTHGYPKFQQLVNGDFSFADPIGLGSEVSLILAVIAEFFCSLLIILGLATRFATIPLIINMSVAFFIFHSTDPWDVKEKAFLFLMAFVTLFFTGPGNLSLDRLFYSEKKETVYKG